MINKGVALTSKQLQELWNVFANSYHKNLERNLFAPYFNLCNLTNIFDKRNILELSCGAGEGLNYLLSKTVNNNLNIFTSDMSETMLGTTHNLITTKQYNNLKTNIYYDKDISDFKNKLGKLIEENENKSQTQSTLSLLQLDNEDLSVFPSNSLDTVISNFSLHLVNDPGKMLRESSRVLHDKGAAAFSLFGKPKNSLPFTIVPNALKKMELELPPIRSLFHISNIEKLKPLVLSNGFDKVHYCYGFIPFNFLNFEDFLFMLKSPAYAYKPIVEKLKDEELNKLIGIMRDDFDKVMKKNELFGIEVLTVLCLK